MGKSPGEVSGSLTGAQNPVILKQLGDASFTEP
jgi:hypothetical protein